MSKPGIPQLIAVRRRLNLDSDVDLQRTNQNVQAVMRRRLRLDIGAAAPANNDSSADGPQSLSSSSSSSSLLDAHVTASGQQLSPVLDVDSVEGEEEEEVGEMLLPLTPSHRDTLRRLRKESVRLRTFHNRWTNSHVSKEHLARAGFFYYRQRDEVQCAFCLGIIREWDSSDVTPMDKHRRTFPRCAFILGLPVGNIPYGEMSFPTFASRVTRTLPDHKRVLKSWDVTEKKLSKTGTICTRLIGYALSPFEVSNLKRFHARVDSFDKWPPATGQDVLRMAMSGFFFTEITDQVACLECDVHLRGWEPHHDPMKEHAQWSPCCPYFDGLTNLPKNSKKEKFSRANMQSKSNDNTDELLRENMTCKICMSSISQLVFVPCGHLCACLYCGMDLTKCPLCRGLVVNVVRTYV